MELIEKTPIKIDRKLVSIPLPEKLILYALDSSHMLLAIKPINELEKRSLSKEDVKVTKVGNEYLIELPKKVYDFYHLDEANYTNNDIRNKPKNNTNTTQRLVLENLFFQDA